MNKKKTYFSLIKIFVISILILFFIISVSIDIYLANKEFKESVEQVKNNFFKEKKEIIKSNVNAIIKVIENENRKILDLAKREIKNRVNVAYKLAENLYTKFQNKEIIIEAIRNFTCVDKSNYFFIYSLNGKCLLNPIMPSLEGKNVLEILPPSKRKVIEKFIEISKSKGEGFYSFYWETPEFGNEKFFKISFIKYFKPLNFFIGTGVYLDDIEKKEQEFMRKFINNYRFGKFGSGYVFVLKLLNINGGKKFAIMLVNPNRPDLIGKYLSDDYKDAKGKKFRKEFLKGLREKGECFVTYWYKKINQNKPSPKLSYFKLTKDKRYIVAAGVYLDEVNKEINFLKNNLKNRIKKSIIFSSSITSVLLILFLLIFHYFDKYIRKEFQSFIELLKNSIEKNQKIDESKLNFFEFYMVNKYIGVILEDYRALFEKSGVALLIVIEGKYVDCNDVAVKLLRYEKKEDLMVNVGMLSPEYQPDGEKSTVKAKKLVEEVLNSGNSMIFQWLFRRKDGSTFWAIVNLSLIPYRSKKAVLVTCLDISDLKKMEENLINEKERLAVTLLSIGDGVITTDTEKRVQLMNKVAEKLTGFSLSEAKGKKIDEIFNIIDEETGEKIQNPIEEVLKSGYKKELHPNVVLISKNGKRINISDSASPIRDKNSKIIGAILVFRDESEKIKMRKELMKIDRLKSISLLAGGIAHDFNNLLTGIYGNLELANFYSNEKVKKYINNAISTLERAQALTKQLLTFSKGGDPVLGNVDIVTLVKQVADFNISGSPVKIIYKIDKDIWNVNADKGQISQVISNLVINAKQAMPNGGNITIEIKNIEFKDFNEKLNLIGKYVMIKIKDEGIGIPENIIHRIFDPYFTTKEDGSGLGLSIVYSIIKKHNGAITVESIEKKGAIFTIYLPVSNKKDISDEKINIKFLDDKLKGKKVLIMDDDESIREVNKEIFEAFGCKVELAKNGEEAIEKYKEHKFDLVVMDLTIKGGMGGEKAVKEILKIDKNAKVIVSSGYYSDPIMANYKKYGFKAALFKPFKIEELKKILAELGV